jgi:hypothetical protein
LPLGLGAKTAKEIFGNDELKHGVPEELQTLIIKMMALRFMAEAGMSQRFRQQK